MNIMNKKILLIINLYLLTFSCYGQVYHKQSERWLKKYPLSATQFEQNRGIDETFDITPNNLAHSMFLPLYHIEHNRNNVSILNITKYGQTKKWDETIWVKEDVTQVKFTDEGVIVNKPNSSNNYFRSLDSNGLNSSNDFFTVLDSKGGKEKSYGNMKFKYKRDKLGRVEMIFLYDYDKLETLYKYTYEHPSNKNTITRIDRFTHLGELIASIIFTYDGDNITSVYATDSNGSFERTYSYDTLGNPISVHQVEIDRALDKSHTMEYKLSYKYSGDKISSCVCRFGEQTNQYEQWNFKYDNKGNWIEMEIPTDGNGIKYIREITYE